MKKAPTIDWQGHRGARGILPENSIPSFLVALEYLVTTLELDVVVSKDNQIIVSHDPWMSAEICTKPDGVVVSREEQNSLLLYNMTYEEIQGYDCGSRGNTRFAEQKPMKVAKPSLKEVVLAVQAYVKEHNIDEPFYNIEIKNNPNWYNSLTPDPETFARLLLEVIDELGIKNQMNIQSFDIQSLQAVHKLDSSVRMALLIENKDSFAVNLERLGFQPEIYSPYHELVTPELVAQVHKKGMKIIPWTVNTVERMQELLALGVDGIITDYPNYIAKVK